MSIDMKQFHAVFFEESQEHLDEMEQLLLDLDLADPDVEMLNSIFRAAHSIKGGSGIFGFDALAGVTHIMESLLDKIRQGTMAITSEMVDLFLGSVDQLKEILRCYRTNDQLDWNQVQALTRKLELVTSGKTPAAQDAADVKKGYGFFVDVEEKKKQPYGFFEKPVVDEGFGFFDDTVEPQVSGQPATDDGFGFFDDLPDPATAI